jgi:hypothetical protein
VSAVEQLTTLAAKAGLPLSHLATALAGATDPVGGSARAA